jgi:uncharacterized membrane protein
LAEGFVKMANTEKEVSKVEQMWNRVSKMSPDYKAADWTEQPRTIQDAFIQAINVFAGSGSYVPAMLCFQNAKKVA